jgi:hypothetical protein
LIDRFAAPSLRVASLHAGLSDHERRRIAHDFAIQDPHSPQDQHSASSETPLERLGPEPTAHSARRRWLKRRTAVLQSQEERVALPSLASAPQVVVCTDLAARGLDTVSVSHVVQLDFASDAVSHIHRCGRTGRLDRAGRVTCILEPSDSDLARAIRESHSDGLASLFSRGRSLRKQWKRETERN